MLRALLVVVIENHKLNFTHLRIPYPPQTFFGVIIHKISVVPCKLWKKPDPEFRIRKLDLGIISNYISYLRQNCPLLKISLGVSDWNEKKKVNYNILPGVIFVLMNNSMEIYE